MKIRTVLALVLAGTLGLAAEARAEVKLIISNGRVTLNATNATVREILAEWAKVGQTRVVNGERIPGGPVTLQLTNVTEAQALDVILRSVSGYVAAPRPTLVANASRFDRILVLPTSTPPRATAAPPPTFVQPQPQFNLPPIVDNDDDDQPARNVVIPNPRGPIFNTFPQPNAQPPVVQPARQAAPVQTAPGAPPNQFQVPTGVAVPGMVAQPPQQPGQPTTTPEPPGR